MKQAVLCVFLFVTSMATFAQQGDEQTIRGILHSQTVEWNKGNVEAFMQGYWKSDSLMFIGKTGITYGYQATLDNYKKGYPNADAMGKLSFNILKVERLSSDSYFVVGKWMLTRTIGNIDGHYTLLFRKIGGEWKIVADHSS